MSTFINVLMMPVMFLNVFGGIIGAVWLIIIEKWTPLGIAILAAIISSYIIRLALMPAMLLSIPATTMIKKGPPLIGHFFMLLSHAYIFGVLWYWSISLFGISASYIRSNGNGIPLLLITYFVATAPIGYIANKDSDSPTIAVTAMCTMLGCAVFMLSLMFGVTPGMATILFVVIMIVGIFINLVTDVQMATARKVSK